MRLGSAVCSVCAVGSGDGVGELGWLDCGSVGVLFCDPASGSAAVQDASRSPSVVTMADTYRVGRLRTEV